MKYRVFLFVFLIMTMAIPQSVMAYDFSAVAPTGQTLYYNISGSNVSVTYPGSSTSYNYSGYTRPSDTLTIPSSVTHYGNTYTVTSIGNYAFYNCTGLKSVNIPNSVTQIGDHAFYSCMGMTSLTIPNSVTSIGNRAFFCCGLTSLTIPNSVTSIGNNAFVTCKNLTSIVVASDNIYYDSRDNCNAIIETSTNTLIAGCQTTVIPNSVTSIAADVFSNLDNMLSVTIPNSVTSIGEYAFFWCSSLTSVTIPDSVTSIGSQAFYMVKHIEYHGSATGAPWGAISMNGYTESDFVYSDSTKTNLIAYIGTDSTIVIPNSVTSIGIRAFYYCSSMTSVTIGDSVTSIGDSAFFQCSNLTSVTIPNSVTSIGNRAFYGCRGLTSVTISNSITSIGEYTFGECRGLISVTIPNSVTSIGNYAFAYCFGLTSVTIGNSVTSIGSRGFFNCQALTEVTILRETAPTLGSQAFDVNGSNRIFNIPCGSYNSYYNGSGWTSHRSALHEIIMFELFVNTNDSTKGVASIVQQIGYINPCDSSAIIIATANYGYHFDHWSNGNIANPDTLYLVGDSTVTAIFVPNQYVLTVQSADDSLGSVTGGGTYEYLGECSVSAVANYGYHFIQWNDGDTTNPRTITLTQDTNFIAYFDRNEYQLTLASSDSTLGTVTGGGTYLYLDNVQITADVTAEHSYFMQWSDDNRDITRDIVITADLQLTAIFAIDTYMVSVTPNDMTRGMAEASGTKFAYGTPCTVTATAFTGYSFIGWSNGETANPYTFAVISDMELTALFEEIFTVTVESADTTMGSATVNGDTSVTVINGETVTLTATANPDYHFTQWSDGNTESVRIVTVTANITYTAYFAIDSSFVSIVINDETMGNVTGGGSYAYGDTATLTATANDGYLFEGWSITPGYQDIITDNPFTLVVTEDLSIVAYFIADSTVGIGEVGGQRSEVRVYAVEGRIVVEGAEGETVRVYDMMGRMVAQSSGTYAPGTYAPALTGTPSNLEGEFRVPTSGVYMVKIGDTPARKVVVVR